MRRSQRPSLLSQLRKDVEEKDGRLREGEQLLEQLQGKLRQLREERASAAKEAADLRWGGGTNSMKLLFVAQ